VLLLPVWVVLMLLLGAGVGLAASAVMVKYRDVAYIVPWLVQVMLFAAPVAYALDTVPANLQTLYSLNPLTWLLEEFRWSLLGTPAPETWQIGASVVVCVGVFVAGALVFQQLEREFADVI
jgi:lipopolysaccharide transport system permease protein